MLDFQNRRSIRLPGYDYSQQGLYFVTICIQHMGHIMGTVGVDTCVDPNNKSGAHQNLSGNTTFPGGHMGPPLQMVLNDVGKMMEQWWNKIPEKFPGVELDVFQTMPNHLHGILIVGADPCVRPLPNPCVDPVKPCVRPGDPVTLGTIIQWFKTMTTNEYINHVRNDKWVSFPIRLWQRNFYEHIIRDESEYKKIVYYIQNNPRNAIVGVDPCVDPNNKTDTCGSPMVSGAHMGAPLQ